MATDTPWTHTPSAPYVPTQEGCSNQRWFGDGKSNRSLYTAGYTNCADVYRDGRTDLAEVRLRVGFGGGGTAEVSVQMTAAQLRELARRALDAAHDLETYPAAVLAATTETAEA